MNREQFDKWAQTLPTHNRIWAYKKLSTELPVGVMPPGAWEGAFNKVRRIYEMENTDIGVFQNGHYAIDCETRWRPVQGNMDWHHGSTDCGAALKTDVELVKVQVPPVEDAMPEEVFDRIVEHRDGFHEDAPIYGCPICIADIKKYLHANTKESR